MAASVTPKKMSSEMAKSEVICFVETRIAFCLPPTETGNQKQTYTHDSFLLLAFPAIQHTKFKSK